MQSIGRQGIYDPPAGVQQLDRRVVALVACHSFERFMRMAEEKRHVRRHRVAVAPLDLGQNVPFQVLL